MRADESADAFGEEFGRRCRNLHLLMAFLLMTVRTRPHRLRTRPRLGRRAMRAAGTIELTWREPPPAPQARELAAGGPQDRAAYTCSCGYAFEAPVSTTVGCPHCGGTQAW
jgi:hypothetical protein